MKTREEVSKLKRDRVNDNCWDLECTEGFEEYHDELLKYRQEKEVEWETQRLAYLQEKSITLGCPGNLDLVRYIEKLEYDLAEVRKILTRHIEEQENALYRTT